MQIEVPSDKYDAAVEAMQDKIRKGKVPGVKILMKQKILFEKDILLMNRLEISQKQELWSL